MITAHQLVHDYGFDIQGLARLVALVTDDDRVFLYQNKMVDSSQFGRCSLLVAGPGRAASDPDNMPAEIDPDDTGGLPSCRQQLTGEIDLQSVDRMLANPTAFRRHVVTPIPHGDDDVRGSVRLTLDVSRESVGGLMAFHGRPDTDPEVGGLSLQCLMAVVSEALDEYGRAHRDDLIRPNDLVQMVIEIPVILPFPEDE